MSRWSRSRVGLNQRALVGHVTYPCVALEPSTPAETPAHRHAVQSTSGHDTVHCPQFVTQTLVFNIQCQMESFKTICFIQLQDI